ncbi:MAG: tryptophan--tRNA ligase [Clostridiaceae bacterium]|nr:tryptophan--tRNA ligase [Clostridiaceae bacterium]MBW4859106.1 tryptophan--tRNA ligase [Clostridiaceae bacterium]MBW4867862.1 tryptophan--tRNA ligase [Clostridiaceae bacterium]MBW4867947.1 tryptophan--tRNA ligase [Clostridiaceae bacterium]
MEEKKTVFSGVQPSGALTIGNYIGSIRNWIDLQDDYNCFYSIVDLHAITVPQVPKDLRKNTLDLLALYLASGLDPEKSTIFIQSHVSAHTELTWVLNTMSYMGQLSRMTQFKEKSKRSEENLNAGLFTYPVLMASDILLYQTDLVPVGEDQKQHLELARDLAERFNNRYSETFKVPDPLIKKVGARIMSLQNPESKMSKSDDNENGYILLLDSPDIINRKIKRAVTDSLGLVKYSDEQPEVKNLINIYSAFSGNSIEEIESKYEGAGYGQFKKDLAEVVIEGLRPLQEKYDEYMKNKDYLEEVYRGGAEKAERVARKTLRKVYKKVGFIPR